MNWIVDDLFLMQKKEVVWVIPGFFWVVVVLEGVVEGLPVGVVVVVARDGIVAEIGFFLSQLC
jgi:hypothetical protein